MERNWCTCRAEAFPLWNVTGAQVAQVVLPVLPVPVAWVVPVAQVAWVVPDTKKRRDQKAAALGVYLATRWARGIRSLARWNAANISEGSNSTALLSLAISFLIASSNLRSSW